MRQFVLVSFGFIGLLWIAGCGGAKKDVPADKDSREHSHPLFGPHQGMLVELGEEDAHGEIVNDTATHKVTLYILDGKIEKDVPIEQQEIVLKLNDGEIVAESKLTAVPLDDEREGKSSRFEVIDEKQSELLEKKGVKGHFNVTVGSKPFIGEFTTAGHDAEGKK